MWVGAGPQFGFAVRFPATPPWLPKQNVQQHQMWKKSPNEVGKPHKGFGSAFSELHRCQDPRSSGPVMNRQHPEEQGTLTKKVRKGLCPWSRPASHS